MRIHNKSFNVFVVFCAWVTCLACSGKLPDTPVSDGPSEETPVAPPDDNPATPPEETQRLGEFGTCHENFNFPDTQLPVDPDLKMWYLDDAQSYSPALGYIRSADGYNTATSEEFTDAYYEVLRNTNADYISRRAIGTDNTGRYTMWCYTFAPSNYETTVYIQAGVHGRNEFESYYAVAMMMKMVTDASKSNDPHLRYLREKVRFIVVPVVNVFDVSRRAEKAKGISGDPTYSPYNSQNINLNRDWFDDRTQEVKNIKALLAEYADADIAFALDAHTDPEGIPGWGAYLTPYADGMPEEVNSKILSVANFLYERNIAGKVTWNGSDLLKAFMGGNKDYPASSAEWRNNHNGEYARGTITNSFCQGFWKDLGIYSLTGEHGARKFGAEGSKVEMCRAVELYLNHILVHLDYGKE